MSLVGLEVPTRGQNVRDDAGAALGAEKNSSLALKHARQQQLSQGFRPRIIGRSRNAVILTFHS